MTVSRDKNKGILFIIIGGVLFVLFVGKFILQIVGAIVGIALINYGLYLQNFPPVWIIIQEWLTNIKFK
jgi:predicted ABC-type sugar transport system permease subunit